MAEVNWRKTDRLQDRQMEEVALLATVVGAAFMVLDVWWRVVGCPGTARLARQE